MIALSSLILPIALGWVWCRALRALPPERGPLSLALHLGLAIALGFGFSGGLYFLLTVAGLGNILPIAMAEFAILAAGIFLMLRSRDETQGRPSPWRFTSLHYGLAAGLTVLMILGCAVVSRTYAGAPHGRWDAWAIWNLRARYLAGEGTWSNSVSPLLAETHPEYPLGTSSVIARTWVYGGRDFDPAVPAVIAALYALATLLILVGALGVIRGPTIGLLAGGLLMSGQNWVAEAASQYADIPLGLYFVAALSLLALAIHSGGEGVAHVWMAALAGLLAAFGAFVKNEGLAFVVVVLVALAIASHGRRQLRGFAIGLAPALTLVLIYKFFVARPDPEFAQGFGLMASKVTDLSRWGAILSTFVARLWTLGDWYSHPILMAVIVWFFFRSGAVPSLGESDVIQAKSVRAEASPLWIASALMIAAYVGVYLITPADLKWQLDTSTDRLLVQILPCVLLSILIAAAREQGSGTATVEAKADSKVVGRKRKSSSH